MSNPDTFAETKNALFNTGESNILALDSTDDFSNSYVSISSYAAYIGKKLADVLLSLYEAGLNPEDIHIIGHSLGAHIGGFAGKTFESSTGSKVGRITGLDPAGPCFLELDVTERLNPTDADFVDIIHSNAGLAGMEKDIGHVDFYPNGGGNQPGCNTMGCSHDRATQLFARTISEPERFLAVKCDSWDSFKRGDCDGGDVVPMGFGATPDQRGAYFLQTGRNSPYGIGMSGTKYDRFLSIDI